jgi:FK506-binding protein 8
MLEKKKDGDEEEEEEWEDLLGTGTVLKQVVVGGERGDIDMEAPRKFFALIDIETRCNDKLIPSECHKNFLINVDADLFPGAHLVIPLMDIGEKSHYKFDPKFGYGETGNLPDIPANSKLDCIITLKLRSSDYDEFLEKLLPRDRIKLASRKKERGKFWYSRSDYQNAIAIYESLTELCQLDMPKESPMTEESRGSLEVDC